MSPSLTELLAIAGGVVLVGVVAHGAWQARRAGPKRAAPAMDEPHFDATPHPTEAAAVVAPDSMDVTMPAVARPVRRVSNRIDALIDAIATITVEQPVSGELALQHAPGSMQA